MRSTRFHFLGPEGRSASPAEIFDAFTASRWPGVRRHFERSFEVVALPGEVAEDVRPGDLLVRRALGEGGLGFLEDIDSPAGLGGRRLPFDQMVLRPRTFLRECASCSGEFGEAGGHQCLPGEGPPAALPDPEGKGLHPLVYRGTSAKRSRNPTVGDAQELLNVFLDATRKDPLAGCDVRNDETRKYIEVRRAQLRKNGQDPLVVDCRFGPSTELATQMFQACKGIKRDGKIGPITWGHLEKLRPKPAPKVPPDPADPDVRRWFFPIGDQSIVRQGNAVTPLLSGADAFQAIVAAMRTARRDGHSIFLLGWDLRHQFELIPGDASTTVEQLFTTASTAGVQIRAMLNLHHRNPISGLTVTGMDNTPAVNFINGLANGRAVHDNRYLIAGSHHQKILVVNGSDGLIAFSGGMDLNPNRFQLHDVQCRFTGPAAWDHDRIFRERWADHPMARGTALTAAPALPGAAGKLHVQVARTYGNGTAHGGIDLVPGSSPPRNTGYAFAPNGERSARALIFNAISSAKRFIYVEEQYLVDMATSRALARKLPELELLILLICDTNSINGELVQAWRRRKEFVDNLTNTDAKKVIVCRGTQDFIHSKTWIFDDQFAIIGSANINRRGFTHDSELMSGIADPNADGDRLFFAHDLRMRLWSKHLGLAADTLADPIANAVHWRTPPASARIAAYNPDAGTDTPGPGLGGDFAWNNIIDPDGS